MYMGIVSFRRVEKIHIVQEKLKELVDFYHEMDSWACFADLPGEAFKNPYEKNSDLWKRSMAPPKLLHG